MCFTLLSKTQIITLTMVENNDLELKKILEIRHIDYSVSLIQKSIVMIDLYSSIKRTYKVMSPHLSKI